MFLKLFVYSRQIFTRSLKPHSPMDILTSLRVITVIDILDIFVICPEWIKILANVTKCVFFQFFGLNTPTIKMFGNYVAQTTVVIELS